MLGAHTKVRPKSDTPIDPIHFAMMRSESERTLPAISFIGKGSLQLYSSIKLTRLGAAIRLVNCWRARSCTYSNVAT